LWGCIFFLMNSSFAQQPSSVTLTGRVVEQTTQQPMEFVNVSLYHVNDTSLESATVTDKNGMYEFNSMAEDSYYLKISFIGCETVVTPAFSLNAANTDVNMGTTAIRISSTILNEVEV